MKKTMFKKVFAGIAAVFTLGLCVPTGFTGTDLKPSFETVAEEKAEIVDRGNGWTLDEKGVLTVNNNTTINKRQFNYDSSIKKVIIGDNCNIGEEAFYRCTALTSVTIGNGCKLADFINEGNENLGNSAFWECTSLTSVKIGDGCDIGRRSFEDCATLTDVTIGNSCTVNTYAFLNCTSLTNVAFGYSCTIGRWAFDYCNSIQKVSCKGDKNTVTVDNYNPEIIRNKDKWTIITGTICPKCYCNAIDYKCESCGYFDEAFVDAEIARLNALKQKYGTNTTEPPTTTEEGNTASTFSDGSVLAIIGGSAFLILCGLAAVIIVKRRKKTQ